MPTSSRKTDNPHVRIRNLLKKQGERPPRDQELKEGEDPYIPIHRIDEVTEHVRWVCYVCDRGAKTAIVAGVEVPDWRLIRTMNGWPVNV